ncbi:MAG: BrnT family toxin [Oscillospiraceae bacterium]|jgi:uncharacterized DUF497 family protein|nr:BrnT family toxin [Oscillospiraceae bacterium]
MKFEWDEKKNKINQTKHDISFEIAETVFEDDLAYYMQDFIHSNEEERFIVIGRDMVFNILTVCYCERDFDIIRLISARMATKKEKDIYYKNGGNLK